MNSLGVHWSYAHSNSLISSLYEKGAESFASHSLPRTANLRWSHRMLYISLEQLELDNQMLLTSPLMEQKRCQRGWQTLHPNRRLNEYHNKQRLCEVTRDLSAVREATNMVTHESTQTSSIWINDNYSIDEWLKLPWTKIEFDSILML